MGIEFQVIKDIGTISATLSEVAAVNKVICEEISSENFHKEYESLLFDILQSYRLVVDTLQPLLSIKTAEVFNEHFSKVFADYGERYQATHSETRVNAEFTFEKNLQFRKRKEVKTSYPSLKKSFSRLHDFIDKWIDNDIWLCMTIDTLLKMLFRHLTEVSELYKKDEEMAFGLYCSCVHNLIPFMQIIEQDLNNIDTTRLLLEGNAA